jgi:hypothetical protein
MPIAMNRRSSRRGVSSRSHRGDRRTVVDIMMPRRYLRDVRITLTLDEDIATKLQAEACRSGRSFGDVVNETLRRGMLARRAKPASKPALPRFSLGLRPGIDLDNAERVLDDLSRGDVP